MRDSLKKALKYNTEHNIYNNPEDRLVDIRTLNDYKIVNWAQNVNLYNKIGCNSVIFNHIICGIDKYFRIMPRFHINPLMLISDDIYSIACYILMSRNLIKYILHNQSNIGNDCDINFQFDIGIICNKSVSKRGSCFPILDDDDDDIDEDELQYFKDLSSDSDSEMSIIDRNNGIKWRNELLNDCIGGIYNRLISNNIKYASSKLLVNKIPLHLQELKKINEYDLKNILRIFKQTDINPHVSRNMFNFTALEFEKNHSGNPHYNELANEVSKYRIKSIQNVFDDIYPSLNINRIIYNIVNYEMDDLTVYNIVCNNLHKNTRHSLFNQNSNTMTDTYHSFINKLNLNSSIKSYYPHQKRLCSIIDRRDGKGYNNNNNKCDSLYFFEPKKLNLLPLNGSVLPQWYINASRESFLPNINAKSLCNGQLLLFSFHIESSNIIKCYLWRDSTYIRFFDNDIIDILPKLFLSDLGDNNTFKNSYDAKRIAEQMDLNDINLNHWYSR